MLCFCVLQNKIYFIIMKYLLCYPLGGFVDNLSVISVCYAYCKNFNRTLLVKFKDSTSYPMNFHDYFYFNEKCEVNIISDNDTIDRILLKNKNSLNPAYLKDYILDFKFCYVKNKLDQKIGFKWVYDKLNRPLNLNFNCDYRENVITYVNCARNTNANYKTDYNIFEMLEFKNNLLADFYSKYTKLPDNYFAIQIRNSDRNCDYEKLINENIDKIKENNSVFIATDDKFCLELFNKKNLSYKCFTYFPENIKANESYALYKYDTDRKIKDTISDLLILMLSDEILSNSGGSYINLARKYHRNELIYKKTLEKIKELGDIITLGQKYENNLKNIKSKKEIKNKIKKYKKQSLLAFIKSKKN